MNFDNFYKNIGLAEYPFTIFTTELEQDRTKALFEPSTEHGPIIESFMASRSIIILGERGVGKTAVKEEFLRNSSNRISSLITNFEELSIPPLDNEIYTLIIKNILNGIFSYLGDHPGAILKLKKIDKIYLSFLIYYFSEEDSLVLLKEKIENAQHRFIFKVLNTIYNNSRFLLNYTGTVLENGIKRYIAQNFGIMQFYDETIIHEYFPEIKLRTITEFSERTVSLKEIIKSAELAKKLSGIKPTIFIDSIDEDKRIKNDEDKISIFIESLLSDTALLSSPQLQLVFFIWSTPYRFIIDSVRSQKFYTPTIKWDNEHLLNVLNTRLRVFSNNKLNDIFQISEIKDSNNFSKYLDITNGIPRDLWHLMNKVFEEQYTINNDSVLLTKEAFDRALVRIVKETNFYEYYPRKSNARADSMDIYSYFTYLFKLKKIEFSKSQFIDEAGAGGSATNYLINMERIGLIEQYNEGKNIKKFKVKDKKIIYAILNGIDLRKKDI